MKVDIVVDRNAVGYHRLVMPADTMDIRDIRLLFNELTYMDEVGKSDVVILNRFIHIPVEEIQRRGAKVVVDIDDYWHLPAEHPLYQTWYDQKVDEKIRQNIAQADMVWCTNQQLKEVILPLNHNVHVIPNALPFGHDQFKRQKPEKSPFTRFAWVGGSSHAVDIALLDKPFTLLSQDRRLRERTQFTMGGYQEGLEWEKMLQVFMKVPNLKVLGAEPLNSYMRLYRDSDAALIPLKPSMFSQHKSVLKILEAASQKLPCIASDTLPYTEIMEDGVLFAGSAEEWVEHIRFITQEPLAARQMGQNLYQYCKEHYDLKTWSARRRELLDHL